MLKRKTMLAGVGSTLMLLGALVSAQAQTTITTKDGRGADAAVQSGESADKNLNAQPLTVKNARDKNYARKAYLRFDLASAKTLSALETATLQLTIAPSSGNTPADKEWTLHFYGVPDESEGEHWDEKTITWNTAPLNDRESGRGAAADAVDLGTLKIKGAGSAGEVLSFSSPQLTAFVKADTNKVVTIFIVREEVDTETADNVVHNFASKEQAQFVPPALAMSSKAQ